MFEQELTRAERARHALAWAINPGRPILLTLGHLARLCAEWFVLGALCAALGAIVYLQRVPAEVVAAPARLEQETERYLVYSIGTVRRGVEARCLLVVYRLEQKFTVSC